jgi:hypothetical protein
MEQEERVIVMHKIVIMVLINMVTVVINMVLVVAVKKFQFLEEKLIRIDRKLLVV